MYNNLTLVEVSTIANPKGSFPKLRIILVLVLALALIALWIRKRPTPKEVIINPPLELTFKQLTAFASQEKQASLSPDGEYITYSADQAGNWDIYLQRLDGQNQIDLTKDSKLDDLQPAFSPDGKWIAFRSDRDGGGIFLMSSTGESMKRLSEFGYFPSWSPDGKQIVFCNQDFQEPYQRGDFSELWIMDIASGQKKQITKRPVDAIQPSWSPHGNRIVFWSAPISQRDLYSTKSDGSDLVQITNDAYLDWNPIWSPDGKYVYFASDRGGSINLWRVMIDEPSGKTLGEPEPLNTPARSVGYMSFSANGQKMIYAAGENEFNITKVVFDPVHEKVVGKTIPVTSGSKSFLEPEVSPDDKWLIFRSRLPQEDIYIVGTDGRHLRKLTDDSFKDRGPHWLPDGKKILFQSDRGPKGRYEIWSINSDGSGLQPITATGDDIGTGLWDPKPSPDGSQIWVNNERGTLLFEISKTIPVSTGDALVRFSKEAVFIISSWAPDGKKVIGYLQSQDGIDLPGMYLYSMATKKYEKLTNEGSGVSTWLSDGRRILYQSKEKLFLLDSGTRRSKEILSPPQGSAFMAPTTSSDDHMIYFIDAVTGSDIWMLSFK